MRLIASVLLLAILTVGCSNLRFKNLLQDGSVRQSSFKTEIPFEMRMGLVVIPVHINGKEYDFLVDTGAPNVVTEELAAELGLAPKVYRKTGDSQGKSQQLAFVRMPEIQIGDVQFIETGAAVADFKGAFACLDVDGFIGANLMKEAVWEFDYERRIITISETIDSFDIPQNVCRFPFTPALSSTPLVDVMYDSITEKRVTFDTGSNGYFSSSRQVMQQLNKQEKNRRQVVSFGAGTSGLYGIAETDTSYYLEIGTTTLGNLTVPGQIVEFNKYNTSKLGTAFLKHYRILIDWKQNEIFAVPADDFIRNTFESFGFTYFYENGDLSVYQLMFGSDADQNGVNFGDRILEVNGRDLRDCTNETWCTILHDGLVPETDTIITLLLLQDGIEKKIVLEKKDLLK